MNKNLSIIIVGFDGYSDLWNDCFFLLDKYWNDCPFKIIFVNNSCDYKWKNIEVIHAGQNAEWSSKVRAALRYCNTQYICLLLEDFFVGKEVKTNKITDLLNLMSLNNVKYVKLVDLNGFFSPFRKRVKENHSIRYVRKCDEYGISLQPAIWRVDFLLEKLGVGNYNAWKFEFDRVHESQEKGHKYFNDILFDSRNILNIKHAVIQSYFIPSTISYFEKRGIHLHVERNVMPKGKFVRLRAISFLKLFVPRFLRPKVKKTFEKVGVKFVSTKRDK